MGAGWEDMQARGHRSWEEGWQGLVISSFGIMSWHEAGAGLRLSSVQTV